VAEAVNEQKRQQQWKGLESRGGCRSESSSGCAAPALQQLGTDRDRDLRIWYCSSPRFICGCEASTDWKSPTESSEKWHLDTPRGR